MNIGGLRIFLSGPMTGYENHNVAAFANAHAQLKEAGAKVIYDPAIEYLMGNIRAESVASSFFMRRCVHELTDALDVRTASERELTKYDMLVSLPGWQDSAGATVERQVAESCGIRCYDLDKVLGNG